MHQKGPEQGRQAQRAGLSARVLSLLLRTEFILLAAIAVACLLSTELLDALPRMCLMQRLCGVPCPGCGLTHSWVALLHGDFPAAFAAHAFGPVLLLGVVLWLLLSLVPATRVRVLQQPWARRVCMIVGTAWLVWALARALGWLDR